MKNDKILDSLNGPRVSISPSVTTTYTVYAFPFQGFYENYPCAQVPEFDSLGQTTNRKVIKFTVNPSPEILDVETAFEDLNVSSYSGGSPPYQFKLTSANNFNDRPYQVSPYFGGLRSNEPTIAYIKDINGCESHYNSIPIARTSNDIENYDDQINIYPNPAQDFVTVNYNSKSENANVTFEVFDLLGSQIYQKKITNTGSYDIDTRKLTTGMYFVVIKNLQGVILRNTKLIISR